MNWGRSLAFVLGLLICILLLYCMLPWESNIERLEETAADKLTTDTMQLSPAADPVDGAP